MEQREKALSARQGRMGAKWLEHTKELTPLKVGDTVSVQNQSGLRAKKWDRSGTVVEDMGNRQYGIRMDGSGRLTVRNRRFIRPLGRRVEPRREARCSEVSPGRFPVRNRWMPRRYPLGEGDS